MKRYFIGHKGVFIFICIISVPSFGFQSIVQTQINTPRDTSLLPGSPLMASVFLEISVQTLLPQGGLSRPQQVILSLPAFLGTSPLPLLHSSDFAVCPHDSLCSVGFC